MPLLFLIWVAAAYSSYNGSLAIASLGKTVNRTRLAYNSPGESEVSFSRSQCDIAGLNYPRAPSQRNTEYCCSGREPTSSKAKEPKRHSFFVDVPAVVMANPPQPGSRLDIIMVESLPHGKTKARIVAENVVLLQLQVAIPEEQIINIPPTAPNGYYKMRSSNP